MNNAIAILERLENKILDMTATMEEEVLFHRLKEAIEAKIAGKI